MTVAELLHVGIPDRNVNALVFSPFADIWAHSMIERVVADVLVSTGAKVTWVSCNGALAPHCTAMRARSEVWGSIQKFEAFKEICSDCRYASKVRLGRSPFSTLQIDDLVTLEESAEVRRIVDELNPNSALEFTYGGLPLGRFAAYEVVLASKVDSQQGLADHGDELKNAIRQCLITQRALTKLLSENDFSMFLVYNNLYGANRTAMAIARHAGLKCRVIHGGMDFRNLWNSLVVYEDYAAHYSTPQQTTWQSRHSDTITPQAVKDVAASHIFSMTGRSPFVYSRPISRFGVRRTSLTPIFGPEPTVLCLMSSTDEGVAARLSGAFSEQQFYGPRALYGSAIEWLEGITDFARLHPDVRFVIRPHPREFPNHRDSKIAASSNRYTVLSDSLPNNVTICWPSYGVSLYQAALFARVILNHTSSAGCEMLQLGLPVVTHDASAMFAYPREFNIAPNSLSEYWSTVENLLTQPLDIERVRLAYRFRSWQIHNYSIELSDVLKNRNKWDMQRVLTGLRDQKKVREVTKLVNSMRRREGFSIGRPAAFDRITRALDNGSSLENHPVAVSSQYAMELESQQLQKSLSRISKILLTLDSRPSALGMRIRHELVEPLTP